MIYFNVTNCNSLFTNYCSPDSDISHMMFKGYGEVTTIRLNYLCFYLSKCRVKTLTGCSLGNIKLTNYTETCGDNDNEV